MGMQIRWNGVLYGWSPLRCTSTAMELRGVGDTGLGLHGDVAPWA